MLKLNGFKSLNRKFSFVGKLTISCEKVAASFFYTKTCRTREKQIRNLDFSKRIREPASFSHLNKRFSLPKPSFRLKEVKWYFVLTMDVETWDTGRAGPLLLHGNIS